MQLTHEAVAALFSTPQGEAAQALGISLTALKVVCRKLGISRWPYARVKKARVQNVSKSAPTFELVRNDTLSSIASSATTTISRLSSPEPSRTCEWGHGSMHANGGGASVSSSGAWDGNMEAGCKLDDLGWMLWSDSECLDASEASWWERVRSSYDECAVGAQTYQGIGGNMVFFNGGYR
jgi:hypothetical protein